MPIKVYNRKGNISLKEKAMVREVEKAVDLLAKDDPNFELKPANNLSELEELYSKYAVTDAEFVEEVKTPKQDTEKIVKDFKKDTGAESDTTEKFVDPFNRDEPIVRDYVLTEEFEEPTTQSTKSSFDEPLSFDESFSIPDSETLGARQPDQKGFVEAESPEPQAQQEPMNPAFSEMDTAKQRKKTKRFAKQIVALTCDLLEKGFEWYTMKDITEAKLTEYEIKDEMDLSILLDMPNGEQATVKAFFLSQHDVIREEAKIDAEDRDDLTEALTEVFLEKGIAPTPMQELLLVGARIVGLQTLKAVAIVNSNKSIMSQLRGMKQEEVGYDDYSGTNQQAPPPPPPPRPERREPERREPENNVVSDPTPSSFEEVMFPIQVTKE
jgi:hypothetical protein